MLIDVALQRPLNRDGTTTFYPTKKSCPIDGRGFVKSMPTTITAGMKPQCTIGCSARKEWGSACDTLVVVWESYMLHACHGSDWRWV